MTHNGLGDCENLTEGMEARMKTMLAVFLCGAMFFMAGCSTVKGIGDDISTVGKWMARGSDNVKNNAGK